MFFRILTQKIIGGLICAFLSAAFKRLKSKFAPIFALTLAVPFSNPAYSNIEGIWEKQQRLIESAIRCEYIIRPLWEELHLISATLDFKKNFLASENAKIWKEKVFAAQEKDAPQNITAQKRFERSNCMRDFTIIGAAPPGYYTPIDLLVAARSFRSEPDATGTLMAIQIQEWLAWAARLQP